MLVILTPIRNTLKWGKILTSVTLWQGFCFKGYSMEFGNISITAKSTNQDTNSSYLKTSVILLVEISQ
jgi:hypothetical protein